MKEIKSFKIGDQIPSNAKFLAIDETSHPREFFYEVTIVDEKAQIKKENIQDEAKEAAAIAIAYLNERTGKQFKPNSKETIDNIRGLINRGFTSDDMTKVVDNMVAEWWDNDKMKIYLRPSTLFRASKFENYLNTKSTSQEAADAFADLEDYCS